MPKGRTVLDDLTETREGREEVAGRRPVVATSASAGHCFFIRGSLHFSQKSARHHLIDLRLEGAQGAASPHRRRVLAMTSAGARIAIDGMVCGACTSAVTAALEKAPGVLSVSVSLESKSAVVKYDPKANALDTLRDTVEDCGFDVVEAVHENGDVKTGDVKNTFDNYGLGKGKPTESKNPAGPIDEISSSMSSSMPSSTPHVSPQTRIITLAIGGMSCKRCSDWVTKALRNVPGVHTVVVDLKTHKATVSCESSGAALCKCVAVTGYTAKVVKVDQVDELMIQVRQEDTYNTEEGMDDCELLFGGRNETSSSATSSSSKTNNVVTLRVSGMSCASCASKVEEAALLVPGVVSASVNLLAETATVTFGDTSNDNSKSKTLNSYPSPEDVALSVTKYGFPSEVIDASGLAFRVTGMVCSSCPPRIEMALGRLQGVTKVEANELLGKVLVQYNAAQIGARTILNAIEKLEYKAELWEDYGITGGLLTGQSTGHMRESARYKRNFLLSLVFAFPLFLIMMVLDKIHSVHVLLMTDCLNGSAAPGMLPVMSLISFLLATPVQFGLGKQFYVRAWRAVKHGGANMDLLVALGTSAAYAYSSYVVILQMALPDLVKGSAQFYETSAVLISFVLMGKWLEARAKGRTSDAIRGLIALQPTVAQIIEIPGDGKEALGLADDAAKRAKEQTRSSMQEDDDDEMDSSLESIAFKKFAKDASTAASAGERTVDTALLQRGDVLRVAPGQRFPADGVVLVGTTSADESALTGESMPVTKKMKSPVIGGTVNSGGGSPLILCTNVGSDSMLAKVVRLIEDAQVAKAPIQAYADKVSSVFVPFVVVAATITWIIWFICAKTNQIPNEWTSKEGDFLFSFLFGITVLVIACPCALGLATPTAVMVGTGLGAKYGILIKGGKPLETAHAASHVLFDKTGTITMGRMAVTNIVSLGDINSSGASYSTSDILRFVASAEVSSEHPVGKAIVQAARKGVSEFGGEQNNSQNNLAKKTKRIDLLPCEHFEAAAGKGVTCRLRNGFVVTLGNIRYMHEQSVVISGDTLEQVRTEEEKGQTVVVVHVRSASENENESNNKKASTPPIGLVCVSDPIRSEAAEAIHELKKRGITTSIVSGDNWRVARAVAAKVGIQRVVAEALPGDKVQAVKDAQRDARAKVSNSFFGNRTSPGGAVIVVGDGINDAPAMAQSDLGIAIGAGTDVAMEQAGVVLVKSNLLDVVAALDISKKTFAKIKLNLFFSLAYNVVGIPIAAGALYPAIKMRLPPEIAALAMALSSVSVVLSSLMLTQYRPPIGSFASDTEKKRNAILSSIDSSILAQKRHTASGTVNPSEIQLIDGGGGYAVGVTPM